MSDFELLRSVPVLPTADLAASAAFYRDVLGFDVAFEVPAFRYMGIVRGPIGMHLDANGPAHPISVRIDVSGIDAFYATIPHAAVMPEEDIADHPGRRQFSVKDPSGNRITFSQNAN